jgi:hypothetical protein
MVLLENGKMKETGTSFKDVPVGRVLFLIKVARFNIQLMCDISCQLKMEHG